MRKVGGCWIGKSERLLALFKGGGCIVSPKFHFFFFLMLIKAIKRQDGIAIGIACTFLGGLQLGSSNAEKWVDHQRKKFFINNSVEALIPFREEHQGLY